MRLVLLERSEQWEWQRLSLGNLDGGQLVNLWHSTSPVEA